jgi:hypothetical protein
MSPLTIHSLEQVDGNAGGVAIYQEEGDAKALVASVLSAGRHHHQVAHVRIRNK